MSRFKKRAVVSGFTLMEMLVVITIIVIIAAIALPLTAKTVRRLGAEELDSKARTIYLAAQSRLTELRAMGEESLYRDSERSKPAGEGTLRYVASYDGETDPIGIFGADLADYDIMQTDWVIVFDSESGSVREVFYSEDELNYDPATFGSYRELSYRLEQGADKGYYGGETVSILNTATLSPKITIENGEELIAHLICESGSLEPLGFEITLSDESGNTAVRTVNPLPFGGSFSHDLLLDSPVPGSRFGELFPELNPGEDITIELKVTGSDHLTDSRTAKAAANSLFASKEGDTAIITHCRHLQNLDSSSGVGEAIKKAVQKSSLYFGDTESVSDWYTISGGAAFKPIENSNLSAYDGSYKSIISVIVDGEKKYKEEQSSTVIYDLNVVSDGSCGLFSSLSDGETLSLKNIHLCNAHIGAESVSGSGAAGGLLGKMSGGSLEIEGCRVYLDASRSAIRDIAYISGRNAGGLIGEVTGGRVKISRSFGATVVGLGGKTVCGGGLIGLCANGETIIEGSYADCYINGQSVGGLIGSTQNSPQNAVMSISESYAAGYLNVFAADEAYGAMSAAGLVMGCVSDSHNVYTVTTAALPEAAEYYTTYAVYSGAEPAKNTYYLYKAGDNDDAAGTVKKSYIALSQDASLFDTAAYTKENSGRKSCPYNLKKQGLGDYSYPRLAALPHYGDWKADFETGALVYFEEYENGSFGFRGANTDTLFDTLPIVGDGYAIVLAYDADEIGELKISIDDSEYISISPSSLSGKTVTDADSGESYTIYPLPVDICDSGVSGGFYKKLTIDVSGAVKSYYFNPDFAACITEGAHIIPDREMLPEAPASISIRTARQLYSLSRDYKEFYSETAASTFIQEVDISYSSYDWTRYSQNGKPFAQSPIGSEDSAPFGSAYNGGGHSIAIDILLTGGETVGLFGINTGTISNIRLDLENSAVTAGAAAKTVGSVVGENRGAISGCLVCCAKIEVAASAEAGGEALYIGGFAGRNTSGGEITGCTAQIDEIFGEAKGREVSAGGFVGENIGRISNGTSLSYIDISSYGERVAIAGFAACNIGSIEISTSASALLPRDYTYVSAFAQNQGGDIIGCRYLGGGIFGYIGAVCRYDYDSADSAVMVGYDSLSAEEISLITMPDGIPAVFGDYIVKPDSGSVGLFYWELCPGGYHISLIGSDRFSGVHSADLCLDPACPGVISGGYGYYTLDPASTGFSLTASPADNRLRDKVSEILGGNFAAFVFGDMGGESSGEAEIVVSDGSFSYGYVYEIDARFGDAMRFSKLTVYKDGSPYLDIYLTADELSDFGGRGESFFDDGCSIRTLAQLQCVSKKPDSRFVLGHNIDGGGAAFTPICDQGAPFTGSFDGGGYIISGLEISTQGYYTGLFAMAQNAAVSNVTLIDCTATSYGGNVGSIVGYMDGGSISGCCGGLKVTAPFGGVSFGGILGGGSGVVSDCVSVSGLTGGTGSAFYAISGGYGSVSGCFALDIYCDGALDKDIVTLLNWSEMKTMLPRLPIDYPAGALYWQDREAVILNTVGKTYYASINTMGDCSAYRVRLVSYSGQEVAGIILNRSDGWVAITVSPDYIEVSGEYKLLAFDGNGAMSSCRLVILPG